MHRETFREWLLEPIQTRLNHLERRIMSAIDDLTAAETANEAQVQAVVAEVQTLVAQLAQTAPDDSAAIASVTARINAATAALAAAASPSSATPAPAPAPTPDVPTV